MDRLEAMEMFVRIVETGSFSAVARELGTTQPTISKQLTALEKRFKTRLLNRSTRSLSLTESGASFYERCKQIVGEVHEAEGALGRLQATLTGTLHVNGSIALGQIFLTPLMLKFQQLYPELTVELSLNDRFIDLVDEGVDVAVRLGRLADSSLVARYLGRTRRLLCATPGTPPRRVMISLAKRWAMSRALSAVASSLYCWPSTCGDAGFFTSNSQPWTFNFPPLTPRLPKATMAAFGGGLPQASSFRSLGYPGVPAG